MNVRLENLQHDATPSNYVSFLGHAPKSRGKQADSESLRSVSSVRSVVSSMSALWNNITLTNSVAKAEKQMAQYREDIRYLYSSFTKIPALKLSPDHRARLISGYEEFPFDTAVPLFAFKNVSSLEISDLDFRQFHGWDRLAEQLRTLTVRRANVDDPIDLLQYIVLDDTEKRRKRSFKNQIPTTPSTPGAPWPNSSPKPRQIELARTVSAPNSPYSDNRRGSKSSPQSITLDRTGSGDGKPSTTPPQQRQRSISPRRTPGSRHGTLSKHHRSGSLRYRRSSGSSGSETHESTPRHSSTDLLSLGLLPSSKWRLLHTLSLPENGLTSLSASSLAPVVGTLRSLDLSGNLFVDIPDALASLTHLRGLNLSNCMIDSIQSLTRNPLPAIEFLNLRSNRLSNLSGIERLPSLRVVDVRDNKLRDPMELARLSGLPDVVGIHVVKNPFTWMHSNYRVTIFNAFRSAPGNTVDIKIDNLEPLFHEKKHLVDFAPEPVRKPVIPPPPEDEEEQQVTSGAALTEEELQMITPQSPEQPQPPQRHSHRRATSDLGPMAPRRKKKAPRRRIVELSAQQESPTKLSPSQSQQRPAPQQPQQQMPDLSETPRTPTDPDRPSTPADDLTAPTPYHTAPNTQSKPAQSPRPRPALDMSFTTPTPTPKIRDPSDDDLSPQDFGAAGGEVYRSKMQTLKTDLGSNWLAAMNEDRAAEQRSQRRSFSPESRTSTIRGDADGGGRVGGRTLG